VATQFSDPALGGTSGFASQYTPIQFAPLVSLTGPIQGPATPTATAPTAPTAQPLRLPMMGGMAEMPDNAYMTGEMRTGDVGAGFVNPFAGKSGSEIGAKAFDALAFASNPIAFAAGYLATGKPPSESMAGFLGGGAQGQQAQQGQGLFSGLQNRLFGQQQQSVPLGSMASNIDSRAGISSFENAYNLGVQYGLGEEASIAAGSAAASLVAQGVDPTTAVTLAMQNASMAAAQMDMAGSPFGQPATQGAAPQGIPSFGQLTPNFLTEYGTPIAAGPAQTFGIGRGGQIASTPISGGESTGGYGQGGFTGGGWSPGDVAGAYSDVTGYE